MKTCTHCQKPTKYPARGLCVTCYQYQRTHDGQPRPLELSCVICGAHMDDWSGKKKYCSDTCYQKREIPKRTCQECGEETSIYCRGVCRRCYHKQYRVRETPLQEVYSTPEGRTVAHWLAHHQKQAGKVAREVLSA